MPEGSSGIRTVVCWSAMAGFWPPVISRTSAARRLMRRSPIGAMVSSCPASSIRTCTIRSCASSVPSVEACWTGWSTPHCPKRCGWATCRTPSTQPDALSTRSPGTARRRRWFSAPTSQRRPPLCSSRQPLAAFVSPAGLIVADRVLRPELHQSVDEAYRESTALIRRFHGVGRALYAITPRFALSSSEGDARDVSVADA